MFTFWQKKIARKSDVPTQLQQILPSIVPICFLSVPSKCYPFLQDKHSDNMLWGLLSPQPPDSLWNLQSEVLIVKERRFAMKKGVLRQ